jgi:hypothetical protein
MRSIRRTTERDLVRDIALVCAADALVGVSFGAIAVGLGLPLWLPVLLSVVVFAGAAQFIFLMALAAVAIGVRGAPANESAPASEAARAADPAAGRGPGSAPVAADVHRERR